MSFVSFWLRIVKKPYAGALRRLRKFFALIIYASGFRTYDEKMPKLTEPT